MKFLCSASPMNGGLSNEMFKSLLEEAGIPSLIRYEKLSVAAGEVPFVPPELWILNDEDYDRAKEIVDAVQKAKIEPHDPWVCPGCGETIEGQFTSCWQCGRER
jgi:Putative prokaryotic signal transducing protein